MRITIEALDRRTQLEKVRDDTAEQLDRLRSCLAPLDTQRADARAARRKLESGLSQVYYADPKAVRRELEARARQNGYAATTAEIGGHPGGLASCEERSLDRFARRNGIRRSVRPANCHDSEPTI